MRRIATIVPLAALLSGVTFTEADARDRYRYGRPAYYAAPGSYYAAPASPWAAWRAYFGAQADLASARRTFRANHFVVRGYHPPSRYFGPPTNYYAERYALEPYSYFTCPLARRGEGVCSGQVPLSVLSD